MELYIVCFLDKLDNKIIIKDMCRSTRVAIEKLESIALDHVKDLQGKHQAEKCFIEKNADELLSDITIKEGLYIRREDDNLVLYEKVNKIIPGTLWGHSYEMKVNKIGIFMICIYMNNDSTYRSSYIAHRPEVYKPSISLNNNKNTKTDEPYSFLNELKSKISSGNIKLNKIDNDRQNMVQTKTIIVKETIDDLNNTTEEITEIITKQNNKAWISS
jgi:hypothetical protein